MSHTASAEPRGRGLRSPTALVLALLLPLLLVGACDRGAKPAPNDTRRELRLVTQSGDSGAACRTLPDTLAEIAMAVVDRGDIPDARLTLDPACARGTVGYTANAHIQRTYRVRVPEGRTLVARARGEFADVTMAFDFPATADSAGTNVGRMRVDSIRVDETREVAVRVMLIPKLRVDPRTSRVLLTVLVR